ncbi:hypothetical protein GCM10010435_44370 [Winogradskya consettensis]|uniref:Uncharacterized protein n=1 Tax=Winogradskya consettensis TaxID=113560 RepID=A0A919SZZ8_9ACTN|nr:hypothetical protein [Actinoplanes consettensis]GIM82686.1 hypothetical protein Aco04nite_82760 [Actinoplanes consettensis]
MADIIGDGKERWDWVPAIAVTSSPTLEELAAGVRISQWMTTDGASGFAPDTAAVSTSSVEFNVDTSAPGRRSYSGSRLRLKRQDNAVDTAFDLLAADAEGFLVRRKSISATVAYDPGQLVQVYPAICGEVAILDLEANMPERYEVPIFVSAPPSLRAIIPGIPTLPGTDPTPTDPTPVDPTPTDPTPDPNPASPFSFDVASGLVVIDETAAGVTEGAGLVTIDEAIVSGTTYADGLLTVTTI